MLKITVALVVLISGFTLTGCSKGLDKHPNFSSAETYRTDILADTKDSSPTEIAAYNFAVSNLSIESLKANYSNETYRSIAKKELVTYQNKLEDRLQELTKLKSLLDKNIVEIEKIKVVVKNAEVTHDTFFNKWDVDFNYTVLNTSTVPLSKIRLKGTLSINGNPDVLYEFEPVVTFENGLGIGQSSENKSSMVGFLSFEKPVTLEVRNSKSVEIKIIVINGSDYSDNWIIENNFMQELTNLPTRLEEVRQYLVHL
jgi:hypothetical protein